MAETHVAIGSPLARKAYSVAAFAEAQRRPSFRKNIIGPAPKLGDAAAKLRNQSSPDFPFIRIMDLASTQGDRVSVDLFNIITGKPIMGDRKAAGKAMKLTFSSMDIRIDQSRGVVDPGGRMTRKRTVHDLRRVAKANLAGWASRLEDQLALVHVAGARGDDDKKEWVVPLASDPDFDEIVVNDVEPPTYNRHYFADDKASHDQLGTGSTLKLKDIDKLRAMLDDLDMPLQPIRIPGDEGSEENPLYVLFVSSWAWHSIITDSSGQNYRQFIADAVTRATISKHPLFRGDTGMWNGIVVKKMPRPIRFNKGSNVTQMKKDGTTETTQNSATVVDRSLLMGAQALGIAYGSAATSGAPYDWVEEWTDGQNSVETYLSMINGYAKIRFDIPGIGPTDHGVIAVDSAVSDPNGG